MNKFEPSKYRLDDDIEILGGQLNGGSRLNSYGNFGGVYPAELVIDGKSHFILEKELVLSSLVKTNHSTKDLALLHDVYIKYHVKAWQKGLAPKVYGYRDIEVDGKIKRFLYIENLNETEKSLSLRSPIGSEIKKAHYLHEWRKKYTKEKFIKFIGSDFPLNFDGDEGTALLFLVGKDEVNKIDKTISILDSVHPDYHLENVILNFYRSSDGNITVKVYGIDWFNSEKRIQDYEELLNKLQKIKL